MGRYYLCLKALHIAFMVTWFAGLFYLPRLFIYHTEATDKPSRDRFVIMESRLFGIMSLGALMTAAFGIGMLSINAALMRSGWMHAKFVLIAGLLVYHYRCYCWMTALAKRETAEPVPWLRWFNEIPVLFLLGIVGLAVVKPF